MLDTVRTSAFVLMCALAACTSIEDPDIVDAGKEQEAAPVRTGPTSVEADVDAAAMDASHTNFSTTDASTSDEGGENASSTVEAGIMSAAPPVEVAEVCRGSAGGSVCDAQGNLVTCNADGTVKNSEACGSRRLCQTGLQAKRCAVCEPGEFRCTGKTLDTCAADGMSFISPQVCESERLCNRVAGSCTSLLCAPGKYSCSSNVLSKCSADGMRFESQTPCGSGSCDAVEGQCDSCTAGQKMCQGEALLTCSAAGQGFTQSSCASGTKCVGAGQCAACGSNGDCSALTRGCKVGVCGASGTCTTQNAADVTQCMTDAGRAGTCAAGSCRCTPQCAGKQCGDDGCGMGGQCPNRCTATQMCSNFQCVACTADRQCNGSTDGCRIGMCNNGACTTVEARAGTRCTVGTAVGMCSAGECQLGPEVAVGDVIQNNGYVVTVGLGNRLGLPPIGENWDWCPTGMTFLNRLFNENGFWLCVRNDLTNRTFYVGDVEANYGNLFRVTRSGVGTPVGENWGACYDNSTLLGTWVNNGNGFWVCMK